DGNDGQWSSFVIQVGTPPQTMRVFISTSAYQTSVVVPEGCTTSDPPTCTSLRGAVDGSLFDINMSSTWEINTADLNSNIYPLGVGTTLGYRGKAELGFDEVAFGWKGTGVVSLNNQTVAGFAAKDSYLGFFGLAPRASNFTSMASPIPSYMQNLRQNSIIPSLSWAYTAGNQYRLSNISGSLTLGGYDISKIVENNVSWAMFQDLGDLSVKIESITMFDNSSTSSLLPAAIPALLDSSFPYIWLPTESCALFEAAFGLIWDNVTELYLVNDSLHDALVLKNATLVFTLGNFNGSYVNITFPYAAFDLTASPPLVTKISRYFPLKRATNSTQWTLGRTFFQEAYVVADYERSNFSVFQCNWGRSEEIIVAIPPVPIPQGGVISFEIVGSLGGLIGIALVAGLIYWASI
ncbi:acid protease, partial [Stipitochalara longipes BDJ]